MVLQQQEPDLVDGGLDGIDLGEHVDAIGFLVDHPRDSADLTLDAAEASQEGVPVLRVTRFHSLHHTLVGYTSLSSLVGVVGRPSISVVVSTPGSLAKG